MKQILTCSAAETEAFAEQFARLLQPGDVLAFTGGLGAGKTAFVRGLARGLHSDGEVSSPTFALVHEYGGDIPLFHFDMYRINGIDDLYSTGYFDYLDAGGILAIEWSENIAQFLPPDAIRVDFEMTGETQRRITIAGGRRTD